jgi:corrinoid protein of di/trimethylamine methyltransferase
MFQNEAAILEQMKFSIVQLDLQRTKKLCEEALARDIPALDVMERAMYPGLDQIGEKYEKGEYFLSELIAAGEIIREVMKTLKPAILKGKMKFRGNMVIGTVNGDIHDIGKNIFITLVSAAGIEVTDLGVDVPDEKFVEAVRSNKPDILGLSALLTTTMPEMKVVIDSLKRAGLRENVKVIVGGRPVTDHYANEIGADAYGEDAVKGRNIIEKWLELQEAT